MTLATYAKELVGMTPDVIFGNGTPVVTSLLRESRSLPIVFVQVTDPVSSGFVVSLAHPAGNATGFSNFEFSLGGKWLELLTQIAPPVKRVGYIFNPQTAPYAEQFLRSAKTASSSLAIELNAVSVEQDRDLEKAVSAFAAEPAGGIVLIPSGFLAVRRKQIISLASRYRVPAVYPYPYMGADGGLIAFGIDVIDMYRRAASYVDRILKGEKPGDLPVQLPTKFELVVNLKTAKALGLNVPQSLLATADYVIE